MAFQKTSILTIPEKFVRISYRSFLPITQKMLDAVALFFESINSKKDELLYVYIKKYWPREILPNHLTIARIGIGVFLFILLFLYDNDKTALIISLFSIGILTDFIDGPIARALHKETNSGAILDALADRVLIIPIALYSLFGL